MNKDTYVVTDQTHLFILYIKKSVCMPNNVKNTKFTRHIYKIIHLVQKCEEFKLHKIV